MDFHEWFSKKFVEWRGNKIGKGSSVADFAKLFGASHQVVGRWMSKTGNIPESPEYISALVKVYGDEVYEVLGLTKPVGNDLDQLPPELRSRIKSASTEINSIYASRGISPESPEATVIASAVFEKYGFTIKDIVNSGK